ncbi:hypothetical protein [Nautilia lithotrophica]
MKYILTFILILFFTACSKNTKTGENHIKTETNQTIITPKTNKNTKNNSDITIIKFDNFELKFKKNTLIYPKQKTIILFDNNNTYSKAQELVLKKLNTTYYKTNSTYLENYFNIQTYPTIVVLDKNKTIKYENFTPYEILKAEGF